MGFGRRYHGQNEMGWHGRLGAHLSRQRYQRGSLKSFVPAAKGKPKRPLPRGNYWARWWYRYIRQADGREKRSPREEIITKERASNLRIGTQYAGQLTKADAQRVLDLLIARDAGTYIPVVRKNKIQWLRSLLRETIFVMQAAQYGSHHHAVPDRQMVSALVGRKRVRHGLRQTRA